MRCRWCGRTVEGRRWWCSPECRLFDHVIENSKGCWIWQGRRGRAGYGELTITIRIKKKVGAHRFAYTVFNGPIPQGKLVRHRCDDERCINPSHLILGNTRDNVRDQIERGRRPLTTWMGKLNPDLVREIRAAAGTTTQRQLARQFNVSQKCIWSVLRGITWRSVK